MKTLFTSQSLEGVHIYGHKSNWKEILTLVSTTFGEHPFFYFLDSERGYHIKIYAPEIKKEQLAHISSNLPTPSGIPSSNKPDTLFKDVPENSVIRINNIIEYADFQVYSTAHSEHLKQLLFKLSEAISGSLSSRDFFLEEANRMNFGIQLAFISLVRANLRNIQRELEQLFGTESNTLPPIDEVIYNFFQEVLKIENEGPENWVKSWIKASERYLQDNPYHSLVEIICQTLEIRPFTENLLFTVKSVLNKSSF